MPNLVADNLLVGKLRDKAGKMTAERNFSFCVPASAGAFIRFKSVDFPLPELPQSITNSPLFILSEISESAFISEPG